MSPICFYNIVLNSLNIIGLFFNPIYFILFFRNVILRRGLSATQPVRSMAAVSPKSPEHKDLVLQHMLNPREK